VLEQLGLTILDARLISSLSGHTMDTYLVLEDTGETIGSDLRARKFSTR